MLRHPIGVEKVSSKREPVVFAALKPPATGFNPCRGIFETVVFAALKPPATGFHPYRDIFNAKINGGAGLVASSATLTFCRNQGCFGAHQQRGIFGAPVERKRADAFIQMHQQFRVFTGLERF